MPSTTSLGLVKPDVLEQYDVGVPNANMDTINALILSLRKTKIWSGTADISLAAASSGSTDINVPIGTFQGLPATAAIAICVTPQNSAYYGWVPSTGQSETTLRVGCARRDGTNVTATVTVNVIAIQVLP